MRLLFPLLVLVPLLFCSYVVGNLVREPAVLDLPNHVRTPGDVLSSECWVSMSQEWRGGPCNSMTDDDKYRFALLLSNCFLEKQGLKTYECPREVAFAECTREMSSYERQILSTFFTYTDNYCLRAEVQRFHLQSARAVDSLYEATQDASAELGSIKHYASLIHQQTVDGLQQLHTLNDAHTQLHNQLTSLHTTTKEAAQETSQKLSSLSTVADTLHDGVNLAVQTSQEITHKQTTILQQQSDLLNVTGRTFSALTESAAHVHGQLATALSQQDTLLMGQADAHRSLERMVSMQHNMSHVVTSTLHGQEQLLVMQHTLHTDQHALHNQTMQELGVLESRATEVSAKLDTSLQQELMLLDAQQRAHTQFHDIMINHTAALQGLTDQSLNVRNAFEFVVEHLAALRTLVITQFFDLKSFAFYFVLVLCCMASTASKRTAGARLPLLSVWLGTLVVERAVLFPVLGADALAFVTYAWIARKIAVVVCVVLLCACAALHRDYERMNHKLLVQVAGVQETVSSQVDECRRQVSELSYALQHLQTEVMLKLETVLTRLEETLQHKHAPNNNNVSDDSTEHTAELLLQQTVE
uniref:GEX1-like protein n=1 Tax=Malawimonas californiana TaxID=221722 RepID=A0A0K0VKJ1_MALCL|nr:GEX1-like protein [Malawimonas californiana]